MNTPTQTKSPPASILLVCDCLDTLNLVLGRCAAGLLVLMVAIQSAIIVFRAAFGLGSLATQDAVLYMHAALIMLCLAYTWKEDGHVRVDVFYHRFSPLTQTWINTVGNILFLLPFAAFIFASSWDYALESWRNQEGSGDAGGLDKVYWLKALLPLAGGLLCIQGISDTLRKLITLTYREH